MIKNTRSPTKKVDIHSLLIVRLLPNILFLKKYYPCGLFERVLFTFAVWLLLVYLINKRAQLKK